MISKKSNAYQLQGSRNQSTAWRLESRIGNEPQNALVRPPPESVLLLRHMWIDMRPLATEPNV